MTLSQQPTQRQIEVLRAIEKLSKASGFAPTIRELGVELKLKSTHGVAQHLEYLSKKGLVARAMPASARTLQITVRGRLWLEGSPK